MEAENNDHDRGGQLDWDRIACALRSFERTAHATYQAIRPLMEGVDELLQPARLEEFSRIGSSAQEAMKMEELNLALEGLSKNLEKHASRRDAVLQHLATQVEELGDRLTAASRLTPAVLDALPSYLLASSQSNLAGSLELAPFSIQAEVSTDAVENASMSAFVEYIRELPTDTLERFGLRLFTIFQVLLTAWSLGQDAHYEDTARAERRDIQVQLDGIQESVELNEQALREMQDSMSAMAPALHEIIHELDRRERAEEQNSGPE